VPDVTAREAAASGEEYELLLTAPDELDAEDFADTFSVSLTRIGSVIEGEEGLVAFTEDGRRVDLAAGYDHFSA
jgi:thiamine monophosphate kinase